VVADPPLRIRGPDRTVRIPPTTYKRVVRVCPIVTLAMDLRWRRHAGLAALIAGIALIVGSFLPWEHSYPSRYWASSHSGLDCVCGGEVTVALGVILLGLGSMYLADGRPWLPSFARAIVWVPTVALSIVAGWLVTILWADVRDDPSTVAVGIGVFVMAAGAAMGLIGGILMRPSRPNGGREA
jgi:hypothetical protein